MRKNGVMIFAVLIAVLIGAALGRWWSPTGSSAGDSKTSDRAILYWKAPMDPNYRRDQPGKSPMGMDLVPVYAGQTGSEDPDVVAIDATIVNNLGVRSASVEHTPLSRRIETVGYVGYDEDTLHQINTRVRESRPVAVTLSIQDAEALFDQLPPLAAPPIIQN